MLFRIKPLKTIIVFTCLFFTLAILVSGCAQEKSSRSLTAHMGLEAFLYTLDTLSELGFVPRALPVPVTSGELPYGFLVGVDDDSIAVLIGFSGFTQQEVTESASQIIPFATNLLEQSFDGKVTQFTPQELKNIGLKDAQSVHNVIITNLLSGLTLYSRCYISKVSGPQGENVRMDFYGWSTDLLEPGQFLVRLEFQKKLFDQLLQLNN